ncbi:MAG TPA: DUF3152 domain-containing protein [Jatrophihabitans sp.]|nr:DUF3152 domain-containing protein [Jatrophihabitans sp.]
MPQPSDPPYRRGATMTADREDVVRARDGLHHAGDNYGRPARRTLAASWHDFTARYGWRAYALPILLVLTVAALLTTTQVTHQRTPADPQRAAPAPNGNHAGPPVASGSIPLKSDDVGRRTNDTALTAAQLPPGPAYTVQGAGTFKVLKGTGAKVGTGPLYRYSIDVENGIKGTDLAAYQKLVVSTLSDKRSWAGHGVALQRVDSGRIDFRVTLTSSITVRKLCGYSIPVETSCYARAGTTTPVNRVVLNDARWVRGSAAYVGNPAMYRVYMINHEDGHALGHQHAHQCLPGGLAPAMMQQTFGLRSATTGKLCQANPWPYPPGAAGAPGAEQPDTRANDEYGLGD